MSTDFYVQYVEVSTTFCTESAFHQLPSLTKWWYKYIKLWFFVYILFAHNKNMMPAFSLQYVELSIAFSTESIFLQSNEQFPKCLMNHEVVDGSASKYLPLNFLTFISSLSVSQFVFKPISQRVSNCQPPTIICEGLAHTFLLKHPKRLHSGQHWTWLVWYTGLTETNTLAYYTVVRIKHAQIVKFCWYTHKTEFPK